MSLADIITALEAEDPARVLPLGFTHPHSYRGDYTDLGFEPARDVTVGAMLADARAALGTTYQGWKGGHYTMRDWTYCWLSVEGESSEDLIGPLLLRALLGRPLVDAPAAVQAAKEASQ